MSAGAAAGPSAGSAGEALRGAGWWELLPAAGVACSLFSVGDGDDGGPSGFWVMLGDEG